MLISKKKKPEAGDTRCVTRFAWLPVNVDEGLIWLELYSSYEQLCEVPRLHRAQKRIVQWVKINAERIYNL